MVNFPFLAISIAVFICYTESYVVENVTFPGYYKWMPTTSRREDLFCPDSCVDAKKELECCACNALPCWAIDADVCGVKVEELYVEYTDPFGNAALVAMNEDNITLFTLSHINGRLKNIPDNICNFANSLVEIDLRGNYIVDIQTVKCLRMLDTLKLDYNEITEIPNGTFSDMELLRYLSMTNNNFLDLGPFAVELKQGNIFTLDFSYNSFREVDISNVLRPGEFCEVNFIESEIEMQVNKGGYHTEEGVIHGPGKIDFARSKGHTWLNWTSVGLSHYSDFGKYFDIYFYWDNSSVHCDCNIVPFLRDLGEEAFHYWPNLDFDFVCETPEQMNGVNLTTLYHKAEYDNLVCDLEVCPSGCSCTDKQNQNTVAVKCQGLSKFPDFMPVGYWGNIDIELDLDGNGITELPNRDYLSRVSVLKLKGNALKLIDTDAASKFKDITLDISDHELKRLPDKFYKLNPDKIYFGNNPVECDCNNLWIGEWVARATNPSLNCETNKGVVKASLVTFDFLNCPEPKSLPPTAIWILVAAIVIMVAASIVVFYFRYEILLLKRKASFKHNEKVLNTNEYDVFLSFSEENDEIFAWVYKYLLPSLKGYSCFVSFRDIIYGSNRNEAAGVAIKESRNYIVVLCKEYLSDFNSVYEFDTIWKYFSMDSKKQIIVINYDPLESSNISNKILRALTRINFDLNFKDRKTKFQSRLEKRLGQTRRYEASDSRRPNYFTLESITEQEMTLPPVFDRGHRERQSTRYRMNTGGYQSPQDRGAECLTMQEILPHMPVDREFDVSRVPSYNRVPKVFKQEVEVSVHEKK